MRNNNYNYKKSKSTRDYNINNITDAFLALNDIDDEEVIGMVKNVKKIDEGVDISLTTSTNDELEDAKEFIRTNEHEGSDTEIEVIDANADAIEHVKNNKDYIGQVILCCNRCHSNKFIDMDDLVPSEENPNLYNVDEECPFCKESGFGYKVVGQVGKVQQPNSNNEDEENNIEPSVEENSNEEDEVSFNSEKEDNNSNGDEASFDNDVEDTEASDEEDEEATDEDDEEEVEESFDETSENEDDAEEKSKLGEEFVPEYKLDEEEVSNAFKKAANLKDGINGYAEEAWMMNQVISSMNDEEAYYDSWLYIWPDGETREECEYDFGNKEDFEELKETFIDTYKLYHSDGLYDATEEILNYAHKWDKLLDLAPIENFVVEDIKEGEEKEFAPEIKTSEIEETEEGGKPAILVSTLLNLFISSDKFNNIEIDGDVYENVEDISKDVLNKKLGAFNTKDSSLIVCTLNPNTEEGKDLENSDNLISVIDLLTLFNNDDEEFKKLVIEDALTSEEIFRGDKVGAIAACADYTVTYLECPEALVITTTPEEENDDVENNIEPLDTNNNDDIDETLFEEICRENNLHSYKVNRVGSEEYWLNEDLINEDDLQTVYEKYCRGKKCAQRFKEQFSKYKFVDSAEYMLGEALKKLDESGFTADEFAKLGELTKKLKMGDSLKNIQDFAKEHGCSNMKEIIGAMEKELAEIDCEKASKEYSKHPENFKVIDSDKNKGDGQHLLKKPCGDKGAQVSVDGGESWEECSEEEFDELLDGGYVVINDEEDIVPDKEEVVEVDENCRSFKTRKELKEAIEECENNNKPYSVKRSNKDGYRFDLLIGEAVVAEEPSTEEEAVEGAEEEVIDEAKNKKASKWIDTLPTEDPELDLCEDINEGDNELEIIDSPEATEVVEPDEIIDAPQSEPNNDVTDIVPDNLSEEEINLLGKVNRIANDICEAIYNYYEVEVSPALVVADILQDLKLISGAIDISELEDTPINNLTKQMFQRYEDGYRLVDDIMTTLTGEPFTTLPEDKLREAIDSLDGPQFSKENIERMIRSPRFIEAVEQGMIPYIPNGMNHELIESMKQRVNEDENNNDGAAAKVEVENKLDLYNSDKILYDVVAPHVTDLIGNPTTLHYDDLNIYTDKIISSANEVEPAEYEEKEVEWDYEVKWSVDDDLLPFIEDNYDVDNFTEDDLNKFDENKFVEYLTKKYRDEAQEDAQANWEEPDYDNYEYDDIDESVDVDVDQFDDFVNEYFNENYGDEHILLYHTIDGTVSDKGKIVLEGVIKSAETGKGCEKKVKFTLTPTNKISVNENINDENNGADIQKALGLADYKVENDLSEEVWEFKFINDTPNEDIFELTEENKIKILKSFLKEVKDIDKHLTPAEVVEEAAVWEYERNKPYYNKMGIDVCHIKNKLSEVVDQIDFTPLIENGNPNEEEEIK